MNSSFGVCSKFTNSRKSVRFRGRRKSSQKLAKRRTFVWGGRGSRPFSQSKLKNELHVDHVRSAPLGPAANRLEVDRAAQGPTLRKGAANKSIECVQRKGSWRSSGTSPKCGWYLSRFAIDAESKTCFPCPVHQRYHALATAAPVGQKPPLLPSFFPTRRRQACRSASPLLPAVQSGRRHCEIRSMRQQFIPPRRTWVWTRSDCSPTTCAPPAVHDSAGKNFNFALGRETYPHAVWLPDYSRNLPAIEGSIIVQVKKKKKKVTNDIEKGWKDMHSLLEKISNSGTLKPVFAISVRFKGEGGGLRMKLTFFVSQASANFCDGPLAVDPRLRPGVAQRAAIFCCYGYPDRLALNGRSYEEEDAYRLEKERASYGARHHNWPLFVIAAILLSDVARRQLRYRCKAGNESYPTPKTVCACDVRLLNYAWNNADWLTGDLWSWLSANHQRLQCNGPNGHSDVA